MGWTDEIVKELKALWNKGYTTVEIGKKLGVSKNAVVGKAHRLGLESRPSPIKKGDEEDNNKNPAKLKGKEIKVKKEKILKKELEKITKKNELVQVNNEKFDDDDAKFSKKDKKNGISLLDLTSKTCRWPIGDPKDDDFHFCGKEIPIGAIYCLKHAAIAYTTPGQKNNEKNKNKK